MAILGEELFREEPEPPRCQEQQQESASVRRSRRGLAKWQVSSLGQASLWKELEGVNSGWTSSSDSVGIAAGSWEVGVLPFGGWDVAEE